eukprot:CAMPEP_0182913962 /NCGR_PEP_ID=MMETSP0034_2-20130328/38307_1 /TAXON_ID=156128 /ORGANISM="Nephroselmis pyriformis, Strain CCMP717" /LENGTH=282 /DNA_ID=CAMNT_0025050691 /DNA_START=26 /DNA_END=874 /DNA_ORIENTATION=+
MQAFSSARSISSAARLGAQRQAPTRAARMVTSALGHPSLAAFNEKRAIKVIAGLNNFDALNVASIVQAAERGGATHVDIACDADLVKLTKSLIDLPVFVSSVIPSDFVKAVKAGADMVEIGNFDCFYNDGITFTSDDVLTLALETRALLPDVPLSVTVPHTLTLDAQVDLAVQLEAIGVDLIQTEGGMAAQPFSPGIAGLIEKAVPTLAAAHAISKAVNIPVMCASGLSHVTVPMALSAGAAGVGVGSAVNKLKDEVMMVATVRQIAEAVDTSVAAPEQQRQ